MHWARVMTSAPAFISSATVRPSHWNAIGTDRRFGNRAVQLANRAEREMILKQLELTRWNRKKTARDLQISYKALLYKLKQLGLDGSSNSDGQ